MALVGRWWALYGGVGGKGGGGGGGGQWRFCERQ